MDERAHDITQMLNLAAQGDSEAARRVFPAVYAELRSLAAARRARLPAGHTLQTTALVHEAYLRIVRHHPAGWNGARHFYFTAARAMRDILVEEARRRRSLKRGGDLARVPLEDTAWAYETSPEDILAVERILQQLEQDDAEGHRLVLLRFYTGLTLPEIATFTETSLRTVERRWQFLRVWLARELEGGAS